MSLSFSELLCFLSFWKDVFNSFSHLTLFGFTNTHTPKPCSLFIILPARPQPPPHYISGQKSFICMWQAHLSDDPPLGDDGQLSLFFVRSFPPVRTTFPQKGEGRIMTLNVEFRTCSCERHKSMAWFTILS